MIATLFITLAVTLLLGIPVGFSIGISTVASILVNGSISVSIVTQKLIDGVNSFPLMALPLFVLSGAIMMYGSTPKIMNLAHLLLHKKPWGIGNVGIIGCAAFGTISGSGVATTSAIGSIVEPEMVNNGYSRGFTAAVIAGAGTLGAVIPPSIGFVVYAQVANVSISDMFMAGFLPGILTAIFLCMLNKYMVKKNGWGRSGEKGEEYYSALTSQDKRRIVLEAIPPLLMPVFVLGGVLSGIVTATEAAAVACVYALILAVVFYRELKPKDLLKVFSRSAVNSSTILIIIAFAAPFAWVMTSQNVTTSIANLVMGISSSAWIVYGLIILILLILGTFMETLAITLLTTPMFLPIVTALGVDPVAYGITMSLALGIGAVTPPLAVCLFTSSKIVNIRIEETVPDALKDCGVMLAACLLTAIFPIISTFLPSIL